MPLLTKEQAAVIIKEQVTSILSQQQGEKRWGQQEHTAMLRNAALKSVDMGTDVGEKKTNIHVMLKEGMCGNASAFRQSLKNADGSAMFPKKGDVLTDEYQ